MSQPRYILGYKDGPTTTVRYFGPFVSESVADFFAACLPDPQEGGWVKSVLLQPFTAQEGHQVAQLIERERTQHT